MGFYLVWVFTWKCSTSVQLARRVLQLERISASLRRELEEERKQAGKVHEEVSRPSVPLNSCGLFPSAMARLPLATKNPIAP